MPHKNQSHVGKVPPPGEVLWPNATPSNGIASIDPLP